MEVETRVILSVTKFVQNVLADRVFVVYFVQQLSKRIIGLWKCLNLAKMSCFLVFWNNVRVSRKTAQCISNHVDFASLVLNLETVSLKRQNPSNDAVCR